MPRLDSYIIPIRRGCSQSTGLISLTVDTANQDQQKNDSCIVAIQTQNTSQGLDFVLVTAGRERADHIVIQLQPDPPFSMQSFAMN